MPKFNVKAQMSNAKVQCQSSNAKCQTSNVKGQRSNVKGQRSKVKCQRSNVKNVSKRFPLCFARNPPCFSVPSVVKSFDFAFAFCLLPSANSLLPVSLFTGCSPVHKKNGSCYPAASAKITKRKFYFTTTIFLTELKVLPEPGSTALSS